MTELSEFVVPSHLGAATSASLPGTLDLAQHARLAIHGIGNTIDPDLLTMWGLVHFTAPRAHLSHWASAETLVDPKLAESMTLLRLMSGSTEHQELEARYFGAILSRLEGGLYWDRYTPSRPWRNQYSPSFYGPGRDEDFCTLPGAGRMLRTMYIWHELGVETDRMEQESKALIQGLLNIAVKKSDYAFYPEKGGWGEPCAYPRSGWINTDEAQGETEGGEGSVVCMHGHQIYGAAMWYHLTRDPSALDLAAKLCRYVTLPRFWGGVPDLTADRSNLPAHIVPHRSDPPFTAGHEHGKWFSHFHARAIALRGILEFARVAGDSRLAEFVRRSYEFTQSQGIPRMGWINCYPGFLNHVEGCALGDLVALGIRLSDAGLGDYWDDVDAVVRNQLVEQQVARPDHLQRIAQQATDQCCVGTVKGQIVFPENIYEDTLGVYFGTALPVSVPRPWVMHCCTANATQGLYYAWEGALREQGRQAEVNLFINRPGRLLDIDSFLPYAGKVIFHIKQEITRLAVRIPAWVMRQDIHIGLQQAGGSEMTLSPDWIGNRLIFTGLTAGDQLTLVFPLTTQTFTYTTNAHTPFEQAYSLTCRGSTVVQITPRDPSELSYPLYERDAMLSSEIPWRDTQRFVPKQILREW